jgi:SAM-dependent methyltransferase
MPRETYDEVPYEGQPIPATAPLALSLASRAHGGPVPRLQGARVLELGCGDGANLVPLAFHHPGYELVGVDSSARAIAKAREAAQAAGVQNVRFVEADLAEYESEGEVDFVIAHGVYSWIPAATRAAMRRSIRRALSPSGLAYVSFNAQPGWSVRGRVRDALVRSRPRDPSGARERVLALRAIVGEAETSWQQILAHELELVADAGESYLVHEYLEDVNDAFWLGDLARDFAGDGLRYVADASFDRPEGWVHPALRERVRALTDDPVFEEELIDLVAFRQLRCATFARSDAAISARPGADLLDEARVACAAHPLGDPFDLAPGVTERFRGARGAEVESDSPLRKAALLVLAERYPHAFTMDELCDRAAELLRRYGIEPDLGERAALKDGLYRLWLHLEAELRLEGARVRTEASPRPIATVLARYEAEHRLVLTTPIHSAVPLEPIDREIVKRLDGSRTEAEVVSDIVLALERGELSLEGMPSYAERARAPIAERTAYVIGLLAIWGLVS